MRGNVEEKVGRYGMSYFSHFLFGSGGRMCSRQPRSGLTCEREPGRGSGGERSVPRERAFPLPAPFPGPAVLPSPWLFWLLGSVFRELFRSWSVPQRTEAVPRARGETRRSPDGPGEPELCCENLGSFVPALAPLPCDPFGSNPSLNLPAGCRPGR